MLELRLLNDEDFGSLPIAGSYGIDYLIGEC